MKPANLPHIPESLKTKAAVQELVAGQLLFQQGEPATALFVVIEGRLRLDRHTRIDRTTSLGVVRAGTTLNPSNLTAPTYEFDATAEIVSRIEAYSVNALQQWWQRECQAASWAVSGLSERVCILETLIELRSIAPARERVLHFLLGQQQNVSTPATRTITFDRSFKDIARDLGLSAEAFYRTLSSLERDGYLTRGRGQIDLHAKAA
ncbi:MAG: Crp/Fnr family transcriptional regulator [Cyanobacteria bacterium P01_F01_bin.33]